MAMLSRVREWRIGSSQRWYSAKSFAVYTSIICVVSDRGNNEADSSSRSSIGIPVKIVQLVRLASNTQGDKAPVG